MTTGSKSLLMGHNTSINIGLKLKVKFKIILQENRFLKNKIGDFAHLKTNYFKSFCLKADSLFENRSIQDWIIILSLGMKVYHE